MPTTINPTPALMKALTCNDECEEPPASEPVNAPFRLEVAMAAGLALQVDLAWLRSKLAASAQHITQSNGREIAELDIRIVGDREMTQLHRRHSNLDHTTDVLTFDFTNSEPGSPIKANLAVCADEAARRASEFGHSVERELLLYCIHGMLHCAGFDDHDERDYTTMHAEEDRILRAIGVGEVFNAQSRAADHKDEPE